MRDSCEQSEVLDSIHALAAELRDGLAPLRTLPDLHKGPCVDHKLLSARVTTMGADVEDLKTAQHRMDESISGVDKRLDVGFMRIESTLASYGRFLLFIIAIIPLFVGLTVWIVQRVPPNPIVRVP